MLDRLRTDQSAAAGDQNFHPFESIPLPVGRKSINAVDFPRTAFLKWLKSGTRGSLPHKKSTSSRTVFNCPGIRLTHSLRRTGDFECHAHSTHGTMEGCP